eukprot:363897-Chlamydomonas_euryale.AAC.5
MTRTVLRGVAVACGAAGRPIDATGRMLTCHAVLSQRTCVQRSVISQREGTEIVKGDVFQYSSLIKAFGDAKAVIVATGAGTITDPLGPFNVDYQVGLPITSPPLPSAAAPAAHRRRRPAQLPQPVLGRVLLEEACRGGDPALGHHVHNCPARCALSGVGRRTWREGVGMVGPV